MPKSRQQRRASERRPHPARKNGQWWFTGIMLVVVVVGGVGIWLARTNPPPLTRGAIVGEHWHAGYEVHICGKRMTNYPTVEGEVHSHGDGFLHIHPATPAASADNANLGTFLRLYDTFITEAPDGTRSLIFPDGVRWDDGTECPDGETYALQVLINGEPVIGDPSLAIPHDDDVIVIRYGPEAEEGETFPNPYAAVRGLPDPGLASTEGPAADHQTPPDIPSGATSTQVNTSTQTRATPAPTPAPTEDPDPTVQTDD